MKRAITLILLLISTLSSDVHSDEIRLFTYNILSDSFLDMKDYEKEMDSEFLEWNNRKWLLLHRIQKMKADILCLQEVNHDSFIFFEKMLAKDNLVGVYAEDDSKFQHGVATFYHENKIQCETTNTVLCQGSSMCGKKAVRAALITKLQLPDRQFIHVVNTKIKWLPDTIPLEDHPGFRQLHFLNDHSIQNDLENPWVLSGDFNFTPDHPLFRMVISWNFADPHQEENPLTFYDKNNSKRIDYILCSDFLKVKPIPMARMSHIWPIPSTIEPSDHLPLGVSILIHESGSKKDH